MNKQDFDEIFSTQLFSYRFALFLTAAVNFFWATAWAIASLWGGVNFTAWDWATGFELTFNGNTLFSHTGSGLLGTFGFCLVGIVASCFRSVKATAIGALFAGLGWLFAWEQFGSAAALATQHSRAGVLEIEVGPAWGWIMIPLAIVFFVNLYAVTLADKSVVFRPDSAEE